MGEFLSLSYEVTESYYSAIYESSIFIHLPHHQKCRSENDHPKSLD